MSEHERLAVQDQGQATYGMAYLRREKTGPPLLFFIAQREAARHDVGVKVSPAPRTRLDQMSYYALHPFRLVEGVGLSHADEALLRRWVDHNLDVSVDYWDGIVEYTEDALDQLRPV